VDLLLLLLLLLTVVVLAVDTTMDACVHLVILSVNDK
jgi:hypothetical protein